jgi:hypothetical protein
LNQGKKDTLGSIDSICATRWLIGRNVNAFPVLHYILERCNFLQSPPQTSQKILEMYPSISNIAPLEVGYIIMNYEFI